MFFNQPQNWSDPSRRVDNTQGGRSYKSGFTSLWCENTSQPADIWLGFLECNRCQNGSDPSRRVDNTRGRGSHRWSSHPPASSVRSLHIMLHHATQQNKIDCLRVYHNTTDHLILVQHTWLTLTFRHNFRSGRLAHFVQAPPLHLTGHVSLLGG